MELEADLYLCIRQNVYPAKKSNKGCHLGCRRVSALRNQDLPTFVLGRGVEVAFLCGEVQC